MVLNKYIEKYFKYLNNDIIEKLDTNSILLAKILIEKLKFKKEISSLSEIEFSVFSQFGEDGIIQYLINKIPIKKDRFIEFGVGNYRESNTRFLLINNNWSGLIIDSNKSELEEIYKESISWKYDLQALNEYITRENINDIFEKVGFTGKIGLLSIDIDGNDYWIWDALTIIDPTIVICEYNSIFGNKHAITIPYRPDFDRKKAHFSYLYFGASIRALCHLAEKKGYAFIGCTNAGNNAFFVKKEYSSLFETLTPTDGYIFSSFNESRDKNGMMSYVRGEDRISLINEMEVYDLMSDSVKKIKDYEDFFISDTNSLSVVTNQEN